MNLKKILSVFMACAVVGAAVPVSQATLPQVSLTASASEVYTEGTYGVLTYKNFGDHIEISDCDETATEVEIPDEIDGVPVTVIGEEAFYGLDSLTSITIPDIVTHIGDWAFTNSANLASITVPDTVSSVGRGAFSGTAWYDSLEEGMIYIGKVAYCYKGTMPEDTQIVIKDGTTEISYAAFYYCENLSSVIIPDSVTVIDGEAFLGCSNLTSINIPENLTVIRSDTFRGCSALTDVTLPNSLTTVSDGAFSLCDSLTSITILNPDCRLSDDYTISSTATIYGYAGSTAQEYAERYGRIFVALDDTSTYIAEGTCGENLAWTLDGSYVLTISGTGAMDDWDFNHYENYAPWGEYREQIKKVIIEDGAADIGDYAFAWCSNIMSIELPNSIETIGSGAFHRCENLLSVNIPEGVSYIGDKAFWDCNLLQSVTIPENIVYINDYTFIGCYSLTEIIIPDMVEYIGNSAFYGCRNLSSITIPESVTYIGYDAFGYCDVLEAVTIKNPNCEIYDSEYTFNNSDMYDTFTGTIYGYAGSTAQKYAEKYGRTFVALDEPAAKTTFGIATFIGMIGMEGCWGIEDVNELSKSATITGDAQYEVIWNVSESGGTDTLQFLAVEIDPAGVSDYFTIDQYPDLEVTIDEVWIDNVLIEDYTVSENAVNTQYYEMDGVTRLYLHDDWCGTDVADLPYDTTIVDNIRVKFTVSGLGTEGVSNVSPDPEPTPQYCLGDADNDGSINLFDSSLIITEYINSSTGKTTILDDVQKLAADVNSDEIIDSLDASYILGYYAHISTGGTSSLIEFINTVGGTDDFLIMPAITVDTVEGEAGAEVTLKIAINSEKWNSTGIHVNYDTANLKYVESQFSTDILFSSNIGLKIITPYEGGLFFATAGSTDAETTAYAAITFKVTEAAQFGDFYPVTIDYIPGDIFTSCKADAEQRGLMTEYAFTQGIINGGVSVRENSTTIQPTTTAPSSEFSIIPSTLKMSPGATNTLLVINAPDSSAVQWTSDNTNVVTVLNGVAIAVNEGTATIYAVCGNSVATCKVTVGASGIIYGDADCDGEVGIADVVKIMTHITTPGGTLSDEGINNADVYQCGDGIGNMDALAVQKKIAQLITELPESYM